MFCNEPLSATAGRNARSLVDGIKFTLIAPKARTRTLNVPARTSSSFNKLDDFHEDSGEQRSTYFPGTGFHVSVRSNDVCDFALFHTLQFDYIVLAFGSLSITVCLMCTGVSGARLWTKLAVSLCHITHSQWGWSTASLCYSSGSSARTQQRTALPLYTETRRAMNWSREKGGITGTAGKWQMGTSTQGVFIKLVTSAQVDISLPSLTLNHSWGSLQHFKFENSGWLFCLVLIYP